MTSDLFEQIRQSQQASNVAGGRCSVLARACGIKSEIAYQAPLSFEHGTQKIFNGTMPQGGLVAAVLPGGSPNNIFAKLAREMGLSPEAFKLTDYAAGVTGGGNASFAENFTPSTGSRGSVGEGFSVA